MRFRFARAAAAFVVAAIVAGACSSSSHTTKPKQSPPLSFSVPPGLVPSETVPTPANLHVATVGAAARQTMQGFGASGAWWPIDLAKFPKVVQSAVDALLFSPSGIALSGYRYNIGGGGVGVTTPDRAPQEFTSDAAGRSFLEAANKAGVPILTGFVNSAPSQFTTNGKQCGGNLKPGMEAAYAQYLVGIVKTLHDTDHITLKYLSAMNEPDNAFGDCGQEGMAVPIPQRAALVQALGKALAQSAPYTKVIADETTADVILANEAPQWLSVPGTAQYVAAIAHHTYDYPDDKLRALLPPMAAKFDKTTWMTEICCYKGSGGVATSQGANYDPTMTQGFWLADQIDSDLTVAGDSAWYWWTALSPKLGCDPKAQPECVKQVNDVGFNDGLIYYDPNFATDGVDRIFVTKRFYVMGQFSKYVRPGAVRHDVSGLPAGVHSMAFTSPTGYTVVTWNEGASAVSYGLSVPGGQTIGTGVAMTNANGNLVAAPEPRRTTTGPWLLKLPAKTIVTYTFTK